MGIPVLVLGESGSGKSTALRNFDPAEIGVFNVASKPLPFRKALPTINGATYPIPSLAKRNPTTPVMMAVITVSQRLFGFSFRAFISADMVASCAMIWLYWVVTAVIPRSKAPRRL